MSIESARMPDLDFLVPSALVEPGLADELLQGQSLPTLVHVAGRAGSRETVHLPSDASPDAWQAMLFGPRAGVAIADINVAELWAMACGVAPYTDGRRYLAEPAHFTIANDHLRLDDPSGLGVTLDEARALAAAIEPVLMEAGWRLAPIEAATMNHWMLVRNDAVALSGASIERAIGDNVAHWQPRGADDAADDAALAWRRCINEIQMAWFAHPVNAARDEAGKPTINTLWLSGNGKPRSALPRYRAVDSGIALLAALPIEPDAPRVLESFDGFIGPARHEDWSSWREQLAAFDARLAAVVTRQAQRKIGRITLMLCGDASTKMITLDRGDMRKFWRGWSKKPALADLFAEEGDA